MSAFSTEQPGQGGVSGGVPEALLAVRQEAAQLRGALEAIQDALAQVTGRVEALEAQLGTEPPSQDDDALGAAGGDGGDGDSLSPARSVAEWKLAGWLPAAGSAVVTGETLRARREVLGISQAAVAHAAHCSRGLVAEVERGKRRSAQTLAHLANVLDGLERQARRN